MFTRDPYRPGPSKRFILFAGVSILALLGMVAGVFILPKVPAVKRWRADSLAKEAMGEMAAGKWAEAQRKVVAAFLLAPSRILPARAAARLNAAAAHPQTMYFYEKLIGLPGATVEDRLGYADAAIRFGDLRKFQKMAAILEAEIPGDPRYQRLLARYALVSGDLESAERFFKLAADAEPADAQTRFELYGVRLGSADPAIRERAARDMIALASSNKNLQLQAIESVLKTAGMPDEILELASKELVSAPGSPFENRVKAAEIDISREPWKTDDIIETLRKDALTTSDRRVLASMLVRLGRNREALEIFPLNVARNTKNDLLVWFDAAAGAGNWDEVLNVLQSPRLPLEQPLIDLYSGRAYSELGREGDADNAYNRASLAPSEDPTTLFYIAGYFNRIGKPQLAETVLRRLANSPATARSAYESLVNIARATKQTEKLAGVLGEMSEKWQNDVAVANDKNYIALLQDKNVAVALDSAEKLAEQNPDLFPLKITVALGLLKSGQPADALAIFEKSDVRLNNLLPFQKAVFAALLMASGRAEAARKIAAQIPPGDLLPEELALIGKRD